MKKVILLYIAVSVGISVKAQDAAGVVHTTVENIRAGKTPQTEINKMLHEHPKDVLAELFKYSHDSVPEIRRWTYSTCDKILQWNADPKDVRAQAVNLLLDGLADRDLRNLNTCVGAFTSCVSGDFSKTVKHRFAEQFKNAPRYNAEYLQVAGFVGDTACTAILERLATTPDKSERHLRWPANLALSRMGNSNAAERCLQMVKQLPLNDDVTYELLPDLIYTRNRQCFAYLLEVLNSDEKACTSPNPDKETPMVCGYRVMEYLAPVIEKYPLKTYPSGDIDTNDYDKALAKVREWFAKQKGEYTIIKDTF